MASLSLLSPSQALVKGGKRPRAFGRTSNVWQYVEVVQERTTPASKYRRPSTLSENDEEDEDDDDALVEQEQSDDPPPPALRGDALHPLVKSESRKISKASRASPGSRASSIDYAHGHRGSQAHRGSHALPPVAGGPAKKASNASAVGSPTNTAAPGPQRKQQPFNASEIVRRIQALGTSASAPLLQPPASAGALLAPLPVAAGTMPTANPPPTTAAPLNQHAIPAAAPTTTAPPLSEAERLRNDFNSQRGKLYFGCSVAFELFNGHLLAVSAPDGVVSVEALEKMHLKSANNTGGRHRAVFTLIDLTDVRSASSIRYGDAVWLQLSVGPGETSWEQGGVLGAKVREAPQLKALALADDESIRNDAQAPLVVGHPVPVRAYLPKNRDDVDAQVDEIQSRVRNKSSKMLGKWIIRSALQRGAIGSNSGLGGRRATDNFVYNTDEIYLEQDWFYLGADSDAGVAVLRQLPPATTLKEAKLGEYVVERRGAWRIRLLDSSNGSAGLSLAQQQMEKLLLRAKTQLKQSRRMRAGQTKQYARSLRGGAAFVSELREQLAETTRDCDALYLASQERRLSQLPQHLSSKADSLRSLEDLPWNDQTADRLSMVPESRPPSAMSGRSPSAASSRGGSAKPTTRSTGGAADASGLETVCALCKSPSVGYNLCCQIHQVMNTLHAEFEEASAAQASAKVSAQSQRHVSGAHSVALAAGCENPTASHNTTSASSPTAVPTDKTTALSRRKSLSMSASAPALPLTGSGGQSRLLELFSQQDQQIVDVIKYKEKAAELQRVAEAQARVGLSPVATHFRDRFKHVDQLVQQHAEELSHHGIGGHFQRLHAELKREETQRRETHQRNHKAQRAKKYLQTLLQLHQQAQRKHDATEDADDAEAEDETDAFVDVFTLIDTTTMCPLEHPGEGFDVFGNPVRAPVRGERLFPTDDELDRLPPVDTKQALALYLHNKPAVVEMLDGFVDLAATHILPNLAGAMETRNRGALVEFLDFCARAAEFVCARRVQVRAAQLLHAIAASAVGDFACFEDAYDALLLEIEATVAFIRFYREKVTAKQKKKGGAR